MPNNAHPDSTFSSHLHNDWTLLQLNKMEYPTPDQRGPIPQNAHPDSTFSSHLHNDWTHVQLKDDIPDISYEGETIEDHRVFPHEDFGDY